MKKIRPFLKWAGNKYRCLAPILQSLPPAERLVEPFAGSGAIFMNSDYSHYLLGEGNHDLIELFEQLQREGESFITYCEQFFSPLNNHPNQYYELRREFNHCTDRKRRAAIFLYLNRHGYNGLCRYNLSGGYNVPFGQYKKPYFPRQEMKQFHQKSQLASFTRGDFRETFTQSRPGDVIYCDPPYAPRSQSSNFSSYIDKKFGEQEQIILADLAQTYANLGTTVVISNHDTAFTRHHYRHAKIKSFPVMRSISCQAHNRLPVKELVAIFR